MECKISIQDVGGGKNYKMKKELRDTTTRVNFTNPVAQMYLQMAFEAKHAIQFHLHNCVQLYD